MYIFNNTDKFDKYFIIKTLKIIKTQLKSSLIKFLKSIS
jgi:hypothetical protein